MSALPTYGRAPARRSSRGESHTVRRAQAATPQPASRSSAPRSGAPGRRGPRGAAPGLTRSRSGPPSHIADGIFVLSRDEVVHIRSCESNGPPSGSSAGFRQRHLPRMNTGSRTRKAKGPPATGGTFASDSDTPASRTALHRRNLRIGVVAVDRRPLRQGVAAAGRFAVIPGRARTPVTVAVIVPAPLGSRLVGIRVVVVAVDCIPHAAGIQRVVAAPLECYRG